MLNKSKNSIQNRNTHYSFLFSVILMLWSMNVNGQFTASSIPGVAFGAASVNPRNTGCDIREISGNVYLKKVPSAGTATSFRQVSNYTNTLPATNSIISLLTGYDNDETATVMVYDALGR